MMRSRAVVWALVLAACAVARGELVTLRDGTPLQGKVLEGTGEGIRLALIEGGEVEVPWDRLIERDAQRLKQRLGFAIRQEEKIVVPGVRVTLVDGSSYVGVLLPARSEGGLRLKSATGVMEIPASRVARTEDVPVDALEAYTPRQLYRRRIEAGQPSTAEEHFELSQYCRRIGDYEMALEHLEKLPEIDPEYKPDAVRIQVEAVRRILEQKGARSLFDQIRKAARRARYDEALEALGRLEEGYPGSPILEELERARLGREILTARRRVQRRARVAQRYYFHLREIATAKVRQEEITLAEAKAFAEGEMADQVAAEVARMEGLEPDLVKELWGERGARTKRRASYGSGTFLVEKMRVKQGRTGGRSRRDRTRRSQRGGGQSRPARPRKPPAAQEWWKGAGPAQRRDWLLAYFAEHDPSMRVLRVEYKACPRCGGRGFLTVLNADSAGASRILCDRCWGRSRDRIVVFQ